MRFVNYVLLIVSLLFSSAVNAAVVETENFRVMAPHMTYAQAAATRAEESRKNLAMFWLGAEMPSWGYKLPLEVSPDDGGGRGVTSFTNDGVHRPVEMRVGGQFHVVIRSVIPHEVNHTVLHYALKRPLPRWLDEGACTYIEQQEERQQREYFMAEAYKEGRYIPVKTLFQMMEYPSDNRSMGLIYSQGLSHVTYLMQRGSPQDFVRFVDQSYREDSYNKALRDVYGFEAGVDTFAEDWKSWYEAGSPRVKGKRAKLIVFTSYTCGPCQMMKRDHKAGLLNEHDFVFVQVENGQYFVDANGDKKPDAAELAEGAQWLAKYKAATGKTIESLPTTWMAGTKEYIIGYSEAGELLKWIIKTMVRFAAILFGQHPVVAIGPDTPQVGPTAPAIGEVPPPPVKEETPPAPVAEPVSSEPKEEEETVDWADVSIVVAVKDTVTSDFSEKMAKEVRALARGMFTRAVMEQTEGKASVFIVSEDETPERYKALVEAAVVEPSPVYVLVLVKSQKLGLKALIAPKIEREVLDKVGKYFSKAPVELIFERLHGQQYGKITAAVDTAEEKIPEKTDFKHVLFTLLGAVAGMGLEVLRRKGWALLKGKIIQRAVNAVPEPIKDVAAKANEVRKHLSA